MQDQITSLRINPLLNIVLYYMSVHRPQFQFSVTIHAKWNEEGAVDKIRVRRISRDFPDEIPSPVLRLTPTLDTIVGHETTFTTTTMKKFDNVAIKKK
eukprot:sb/3478955/